MRKNRKVRQSERLRTSLKVTIGIIATSTAAFVLIMLVVFNFSKQEDSVAGSPMVFIGAEAVQDTAFVYRGSVNQQGIGVIVQTTGEGNALNLTAIEFKVIVTSGTLAENIENARLWYTGSDHGFHCTSQVGKTVPVISDDRFSMPVDKSLLPGKNHFWLTFDIKPGAASPSFLDVTVGNIKMGALNYIPFISSPVGSRLIAGNNCYFSRGDLLISQADSWNNQRDGSGQAPRDLKDERNVYFIQSGHRMQNVSGTSMASLYIENGGELKSMAILKAKRLTIETGALFEQRATVTDFNSIGTFIMANGSMYVHNNTGYMPGRWCQFEAKSTQRFLQYGMATFPTTVSWGNVIVESGSKLNFDIQKNFRQVKGNLEFKLTGIENYLFCDGTDTIEIDGNLIFSGGNFIGVTGFNHHLYINVKGDLIMKGGTFTDAEAVGTNLSRSILDIGGNISMTGGTFDYAQAMDRGSEIRLTPVGKKSVTWSQEAGEVLLGNTRVMDGKELFLQGPFVGNVAADHSFIIESGATLWCGKTQLTGAGRFVLENNAHIGVGHAAGINSNGNDGNIITGKRIYSSGARYTYYLEMNPQATGKFTTEPVAGTIRQLNINKESQSHWVILSQDFLVLESINITRGIIEKNSRSLLKADVTDKNTADRESEIQ